MATEAPLIRSLERLLLVWVLGALSLGALLLVLASYIVTLDEMDEIFDDNLRQVALSLVTQRDPAAAGEQLRLAVVPPRVFEEQGEFDFTTLFWDRQGHLLWTSRPGVDLPFRDVSGLAQVGQDGNVWHVYTIVAGDQVVQAAQRAESRATLAAHAASKLLLPVGTLTLAIGALLVVALRAGLRSLDAAAKNVAARSSVSLEAIDAKRLPLEIHPLIEAINDLMQRLAEAFTAQRRFVADAAHELRSPVTALRLQLQNLERSTDPGQRAAAIGELRLGIERSQRLIVQLLDLSRLEPDARAVEHQRVDLAALAQSAVVDQRRDAEHKDIDLGAEAPDAVWVHADPDELTVLLRNLIGNAVRYTPRGGRVDVVARYQGDGAVLEVVDDGVGISAAESERVFDRFFRGDAAMASSDAIGSGLGLAIVKAIADRHGAAIALSPAHGGRGLRVKLSFPLRGIDNDNDNDSFPGREPS